MQMANFHEILNELRVSKGVTQEEVANAIGVAKSTFAKYDRGEREPNFDTLKKIARYFGVTADYLLGLSNSRIGANDDVLRETGLDDDAITALRTMRGVEALNEVLRLPSFASFIFQLFVAASEQIKQMRKMDLDNMTAEDKRTICDLINIRNVMIVKNRKGEFEYIRDEKYLNPEDLNENNIEAYYIVAKGYATASDTDSPYFWAGINEFSRGFIKDFVKLRMLRDADCFDDITLNDLQL